MNESEEIIDKAMRLVVYSTRYTPYQVMRVAEIAYKRGADKARYHYTKKQLAILHELKEAVKWVTEQSQ